MESGGYSNTAEIKKQNKKKHIPFMVCAFLFGGGKRDRTADLLHAMQALYQLSYTPEWWRIRDSNPGHKDYDSSALTD